MMDKITELINILLDSNISDEERDDAAINLGYISNNELVEKALLKIANDINTDEIIRASCGESLAQIWMTKKVFNYDKFFSLKGIAFVEAIGLIKKENTKLYEELKNRFM